MVIKKLTLENFKGIKSFELAPDGKNISVYGDNGSGKTSLYDAFCWLLYGKPSTDEKNFTPQTIGTHNLVYSVSGVFGLDDGKEITLKKDYHEVYKTQRGSAESVFSGYTTDCYIDGVPVREKEYKDRLINIFDSEGMAKLLTRYNYFLEELPVRDRRNILMEIFGDISDADVIAKDPELEPLPGILDGKKTEDYQKIAAAERKKINEELKMIPARIDEAEKGKPVTAAVSSVEDTEKVLSEYKAQKQELETKAAAVTSTADAELQKAIAETEADQAKAELEYSKELNAREEEFLTGIRNKETARNHAEIEAENLSSEIKRKNETLDKHVAERQRLLDDWKSASAAQWNGDLNCPTCGQPLPAEQIEEAKKRFNKNKSENLERIKKEGQKVSQDVINGELDEIKALKDSLKTVQDKVKTLNGEIEAMKDAIPKTKPFSDTDLGKAYIAKIKELTEQIGADTAGDEMKARYKGQIEELDQKITEVQEIITAQKLIAMQDKRIEELGRREKELAAEYEKVDRAVYLCELFNRRKAEMLTNSINSKFKTLKFRLFTEQINGGIADDCEALIDCPSGAVPFKSANNAARINAGLEVIDTLSEHFNISMPIFIDNSESNTHITATKAQQIRLYVSNDKELTIKED